MAATVGNVIDIMEKISPPGLAEDWDNIGLQLGVPQAQVKRVLVTLDVDEGVVEEAREKGVQLIISHHPLIFRPIKNLRSDLPLGKVIAKLIKSNIAVYAAHTNLDSAKGGVNDILAGLLQLDHLEILAPSSEEKFFKLVVFVPKDHLEQVRDAVCRAGAGWIGNYSHCTFASPGNGTFLPLEGTNPFIGSQGELEIVSEYRLETIVPGFLLKKAVTAVLESHPYEEVAYDVFPLEITGKKLGLGRIGNLNSPITLQQLVGKVKHVLGVDVIKAVGDMERSITRIAVCGGAGASLIERASSQGAQCLVTGDLKYHEARDAQALGIAVIDAGHYATENFIVGYVAGKLEEECAAGGLEIVIEESKVNISPWCYC